MHYKSFIDIQQQYINPFTAHDDTISSWCYLASVYIVYICKTNGDTYGISRAVQLQLTQGAPAHNALHCQVGLASSRSLGRD